MEMGQHGHNYIFANNGSMDPGCRTPFHLVGFPLPEGMMKQMICTRRKQLYEFEVGDLFWLWKVVEAEDPFGGMKDFGGDFIHRSVANDFGTDERMLFSEIFKEFGDFAFIEFGRYEEYVFGFRILLLLELTHIALSCFGGV
jgi:hypothetical protein